AASAPRMSSRLYRESCRWRRKPASARAAVASNGPASRPGKRPEGANGRFPRMFIPESWAGDGPRQGANGRNGGGLLANFGRATVAPETIQAPSLFQPGRNCRCVERAGRVAFIVDAQAYF